MSKLFDAFDPVTSKQWKQKIQVDLKGADYNDTLIWKTADGIDVKPFYHLDEFQDEFSKFHTNASQWKISQSITVQDAKIANTTAQEAITNGAEHIIFNVNNDAMSFAELTKNIEVPIHFQLQKFNVASIEELSNTDISNYTYNNDIIGHLGQSGNWFVDLKQDHSALEQSIKANKQLYIDLSHYQNAGGTNVQQLAYAMAQITEYLNHFEDKLGTTEKRNLKIIFNIAVGSNYFFEIAKLRALRQLWYTIAEEFGYNTTCEIQATPSKRNKTIYDYNVNMLRTTTECMSAVLGGANIIYNQPYNQLFQNPTDFGERISRNQLLVLKKESYFDVVNNPSDGSYYIESLTEQLSEKALMLYKDLERNGGFLKQLKESTIQRKIKASAQKEQSDFDNNEITLLGTNKHPNNNDRMANNLEKSPFLKIEKRKTLIEPILEKRLAETIEQNRLKDE